MFVFKAYYCKYKTYAYLNILPSNTRGKAGFNIAVQKEVVENQIELSIF